MKTDDKFVTTREAAQLAGTPAYELWNQVGRTLSEPVRISERRCYWLRAEVLKWAQERQKKLALVAAA